MDFSGHGDSVERLKEEKPLVDLFGEDVALAINYCRRNNDKSFFPRGQPRWSMVDPQELGRSITKHENPIWNQDKIYGIGNSLGGSAITRAKVLQAEANFCKILAFEPIVVPAGSDLQSSFLSQVTEKRRQCFSSKEEAFQYLKNNQFFESWDARCLEAFVEYGFRETRAEDLLASDNEAVSAGIILKCDKYFEASMYRYPLEMWNYLSQIQCPYHVFTGENSNIFELFAGQGMNTAQVMKEVVSRVPNGKLDWVQMVSDCGHLMIAEKPETCAQIVAEEVGLV